MSPGSPWGPRPAQIGRSSTHWTSSFPSENNAWQLNMNEQLLIEHGYSLLHYPTTPLLIPVCSVKRQNPWVAPRRVYLFHPVASKHVTAVPTAELLNCHKMDASGCCHEIRSPKYHAPWRCCNCRAYFDTPEFMDMGQLALITYIPPDSHISTNMSF